MKRVAAAIVFCVFSSFAGAQSTTELYNAEESRILLQMKEGALSIKEAMYEMEAAGKAYFPDDLLLNARNQSYVRYAEQLDAGEINFDRFADLVQQRKQRFESALADRKNSERNQRQAAVEAAQSQVESERKTRSIGHFLQSLGSSMRNSSQQPINCTSYNIGYQATTKCQ